MSPDVLAAIIGTGGIGAIGWFVSRQWNAIDASGLRTPVEMAFTDEQVAKAIADSERDRRIAYWRRMLDSAMDLAAGIKSRAFSGPNDEGRKVVLGKGTVHDGHLALSMAVSNRYSVEQVTRAVNACGFASVSELEFALVDAIEAQLAEAEK